MDSLCCGCNLRCTIENYKKELNSVIYNKKQNLLDNEVISISQSLDEFLYKCVLCRKDFNMTFNLKLSLKNTFGTHSEFYYYGKEHLFNNMCLYIKEGINNNEIIYISMEKNLYRDLINFLKVNNVDVTRITFRPVKELIMCNKEGGLVKVKEKIDNILLESEISEYNGIRWIGQPTYAIKTTSKDDFLNWEVILSEALRGTRVSLVRIYNAYNCMNESNYINLDNLGRVLDDNSYISRNSVVEYENCMYS